MVNKIPSYTIGAGGKYAILASRSHPYSGQIMAEAAGAALEQCGVEYDDIIVIDCPSDVLLPGLSREAARTFFFSAVIVLAAVPDNCPKENAITAALASFDFEVPVVPALVPLSQGQAQMASAAADAARAAVEMSNLTSLFEELSYASSMDMFDDLTEAEIIEAEEEFLAEQEMEEEEQAASQARARKPARKPAAKRTSSAASKTKSTKSSPARKSSRTQTTKKARTK